MRIRPLADVGKGVELPEAADQLELDVTDIREAGPRLQTRPQLGILVVALAGVHQLDFDARVGGLEEVDLRLEVRQPGPEEEFYRFIRPRRYVRQCARCKTRAGGLEHVAAIEIMASEVTLVLHSRLPGCASWRALFALRSGKFDESWH